MKATIFDTQGRNFGKSYIPKPLTNTNISVSLLFLKLLFLKGLPQWRHIFWLPLPRQSRTEPLYKGPITAQ